MTANELYKQGDLPSAITAALEEVKRHPADAGKREFLCELLCHAGDFERADRQLDAIQAEDPQIMMQISTFRQLLRGEQARQEFFAEGRLPEFLDQAIPPNLGKHLEAAILLREGKPAEAATVLAGAEEGRPKVTGTCNGQAFDDWRDLDDLTSSLFEILTTTGKYYWIPVDRIDSIEFRAPTRPFDLLFRRVHMSVRGGPDGEVYLPVLYAGSAADADNQVRLGRATQWLDQNGGPVRGLGQRVFLAGVDDRSIMELQSVTFSE